MPSSLHVIRLAGVWEIAPFIDSDAARSRGDDSHGNGGGRRDRSLSPLSDATLDWTKIRLDRLDAEGLPFAPGVCRRCFNRPTNLAVDQPVYLEWIGLGQAASIRLNGQLVARTSGSSEVVRIRVDDRLTERNELRLVLTCSEVETAEVAPETRPAWPFRECRLLIEER